MWGEILYVSGPWSCLTLTEGFVSRRYVRLSRRATRVTDTEDHEETRRSVIYVFRRQHADKSIKPCRYETNLALQ